MIRTLTSDSSIQICNTAETTLYKVQDKDANSRIQLALT